MKTTRKLPLLIAVVAIVVATLAVAASAYVTAPTNSIYADINGSESWVQIAGGSAKDSNTDGDYEDEGDLYGTGGNYRAYYNATTKTVSVETWKDGLEMTAYSDSNTAAYHFTYWMKNNAANIEHIQIRNVGRITNGYYLFGMLTNLKTMTIGDTCTEWTATDSNSAHFKGLTALETIKWGTWNKTTGAFTASYGEDGVWDLRGFKYMKPNATIYQNSTDITMLFGSSVRSSGAKKIVLPYTQTLLSDEYTINKVVISDGSEAFVEGNSKQGESSYGTAFAEGTLVYVIQDASGNQYYSKNNWSFESGWSKVTELAKDRAPYYGVYTGIIPYAFAHSATALAEVVVPEGTELKHIESYAFYNCTALKLLDVKGTVADDFAITHKYAFTNVTDLVIRVYDETSKTNMENALTAAGVTCATVELSTDDSGEEETATMPEGVTNASDKWIDSGYTDVDNGDGWVLIGMPSKDTSTTASTYPTFVYLNGGRFYWNKEAKKGVWIVTGNTISGDWGEQEVKEGTQNTLADGAHFRMAWIFNKLANEGYVFESIEYRAEVNYTGSIIWRTAGLFTTYIEVKTVLFDSAVNQLAIQANDRGLFRYVSNLKTLDHVTFAADGSYPETVTTGVTDMRGFTKVTSYQSNPTWDSTAKQTYYTNRLFRDSGLNEVIWMDVLKDTSDETLDHAGVIDDLSLYNCTSLTKFTLNAPLTYIGDRAFGNCKKLTVIDLKGGIATGAFADSGRTGATYTNAFSGATQAITVYVYGNADYLRAEALFAPWSNITVVNLVTTPDSVNNAIIADGYSIRITDEGAKTAGPALRAEFTLSNAQLATAAEEGYTLSDYGVILFSANTLANTTYKGDIAAVLAAAGTDAKIIKKSAKNGPYVNGAALENDPTLDKRFAAALTGIPEANYLSGVYTYAYAKWTTEEGEVVTYTTYTSNDTGKTAHSLYDLTIFTFRHGVVNSQNYKMSTGVKLWDILQKGAFSVANGEQKAFDSAITPTVAYTLDDDNDFTYLDLPLYAWVFANPKADGSPNWNSYANRLEDTSSTNIVWSLLTDNDELVVVYRRAPEAADDAVAKLPILVDRSYGGYAPYSSNYFSLTNTSKYVENTTDNGFYKYATIHSPILTEANENKITALVIDYGVDAFAASALENTTVSTLETIVYPEGMTASNAILRYSKYVKNIIYASDSKTSLTSATQASDFGAIADLSGLASVGFNYILSNAQNVENVILPATTTNLTSVEEFMNTATDIKRIWTVGNDVPESGVLDLSKTGLVAVTKNSFTDISNVTKIIMPDTFKGVTAYSYKLSEVGACSQTLGTNETFTIDLGSNAIALHGVTNLNDWTSLYGLVNFYNQLQAAVTNGTLSSQSSATKTYPSATQAANPNSVKVTLDGTTKTLPEWAEIYSTAVLAPPTSDSDLAESFTLFGDTYNLTFLDDFNGSSLDTSKWAKCPEGERQDLGGKWDDDRAYVDGNGNLVLEAMRDADGNLTSGAIRTQNKYYTKRMFEQARGYFETRCKLQSMPGFWSAFWLMCNSQQNVNNSAVDGAEIDIMESYSIKKKAINHAVHWDGYDTSHKATGTGVEGLNVYDGQYHTFGLLWTETEYIFFVDGFETSRITCGSDEYPDSETCSVACFLKLSIEFGSWADAMSGTEAFTDSVLFDYVRVYQKAN